MSSDLTATNTIRINNHSFHLPCRAANTLGNSPPYLHFIGPIRLHLNGFFVIDIIHLSVPSRTCKQITVAQKKNISWPGTARCRHKNDYRKIEGALVIDNNSFWVRNGNSFKKSRLTVGRQEEQCSPVSKCMFCWPVQSPDLCPLQKNICISL